MTAGSPTAKPYPEACRLISRTLGNRGLPSVSKTSPPGAHLSASRARWALAVTRDRGVPQLQKTGKASMASWWKCQYGRTR